MHLAAQDLVGEHDFTSFRSIECQAAHPIRRIIELTVKRQKNTVIIDVTANAFLHHMLRNLAGVLISIGSGRQPVSWAQELLQLKDRKLGAETASPYGLYLAGVTYPAEYEISVFDDDLRIIL